MAAELAIPESLSVTNIESEDKDNKYKLLDNIVHEPDLVADESSKVERTVDQLVQIDQNKQTSADGNQGSIQEAVKIALRQHKEPYVDSADDCLDKESQTVTDVFDGEEGSGKNISIKTNLIEDELKVKSLKEEGKVMETTYNTMDTEKGYEASGESEIEIKEIEEKGGDSVSNVNITETRLQQTKAEEPDLNVGDESLKEERPIDQLLQIDENQQTCTNENQKSIKEAVKKTMSQQKEPYFDSADDCLDKEVKTVTEVFDEDEGSEKNISAKKNLNEDELEVENVKEEMKGLETTYNTTVTEKGYEASGESENEAHEKGEAGKIRLDGFTDATSELKSSDIDSDETTLATENGAKDAVDAPPLAKIEDKTEDKTNVDTPMVTLTEEEHTVKVENPVIFDGLSEMELGGDKIPREEHQAEIFEN